jgi:hypothetical protein
VAGPGTQGPKPCYFIHPVHRSVMLQIT